MEKVMLNWLWKARAYTCCPKSCKSCGIKSWTALKVMKVFLLNTFWHSGPSSQTYHVSVNYYYFFETNQLQVPDSLVISPWSVYGCLKIIATKYIAVHQYIQLCEEIPLGKWTSCLAIQNARMKNISHLKYLYESLKMLVKWSICGVWLFFIHKINTAGITA